MVCYRVSKVTKTDRDKGKSMGITWETGKENSSIKPFPKIMRSDDHIVLFTGLNVGTLISNTKYCDIGYHSNTWEMSEFTDYNEPVTLQNE